MSFKTIKRVVVVCAFLLPTLAWAQDDDEEPTACDLWADAACASCGDESARCNEALELEDEAACGQLVEELESAVNSVESEEEAVEVLVGFCAEDDEDEGEEDFDDE